MLLDFIVACAACGHMADEHNCHAGAYWACRASGCDCEDYVVDEADRERIMVAEVTSQRLTLDDAERIVGEPAASWVARCFEIASKLADAVGGVAVYGAWDGPVAPGTHFADRPLINHGWVLLPDGNVFDPTRWVFEGFDPYLYEGDADHYDEGANRRRVELMPPFPAPSGATHTLALADDLAELLGELTGVDVAEGLTAAQWMWCANLPYDDLDGHAAELYDALRAADMGAFVPIDNRLRAEREAA